MNSFPAKRTNHSSINIFLNADTDLKFGLFDQQQKNLKTREIADTQATSTKKGNVHDY